MQYISLPSFAKNLYGQQFGRFVALGPVGRTIHGSIIWRCQCECGSVRDVDGQSLRKGLSQSCGCLQREMTSKLGKSNASHGMVGSPEWKAWASMRGRCSNPNYRSYKNYGGRGIKVCDRWIDSFEAFFADMGRRPSAKHSLDRINNEGNYEPGNCRWATTKEQALNKRINRTVTAFGRTGPLVDFMPAGINGNSPEYNRVLRRVNKGWSIERSLEDVFGIS